VFEDQTKMPAESSEIELPQQCVRGDMEGFSSSRIFHRLCYWFQSKGYIWV